jgi:DNA-binding SARP family transcriptional activator/tetratricopeptide (TPR) repeat protein
MSLRLRLLGTPRLERDGNAIDITSNKAIALLAYLAVTQTPQPRERILSLLWPDSTDEAARKNLRNLLWVLRKAAGDEFINGEGDRLSLSNLVQSDINKLDSLEDHSQDPDSSLYIQPINLFLDGFNLAEAPDFEIWASAQREHFGQAYLHALSASIEKLRAQGLWTQVVILAQRALAYDDLQESMHRILMEAYARLGHRAESQRQYEHARKTLADELGVEPLPETELLHSKIVDGDFDQKLTSEGAIPIQSRRSHRQAILGDNPRAPFIGRDCECSILTSAYQQAKSGMSRVVLMTGEMGIGKSRLWQEWSATLDPQADILETRGLEATQSLPFAPLNELFSNSGYMKRFLSASATLSPLYLAEVARVIPAVKAVYPDLPQLAPLSYDEERRRLFEAFTQSLMALNAQPLILFVDDLHWVDQTTLDWLAYLIHRMREHGLLFIGAYRQEDANSALARLVAGWGRENMIQRLPLHRLTDDEAAVLVQALGCDPTIAKRAQTQGAGNPYFLIELCRSTPADVPPVLSELIKTRLERLPDSSRQVLQSASVLEPDFDFATLRRTSGRGEEETLDAVDALLSTSVLVEKNGQYAFTHPLIAAVVREGMSSARKVFIHRRAAESLEATYAGNTDQVATQLMRHLVESNEHIKAAQYGDRAAQRALALAAPAEAIDLYRQTIKLDPTPERRIRLGQALQWANEVPAARNTILAALQEFIAGNNHTGAAQACLEMANCCMASGQYDEVLVWSEKSLGFLGANPDPALLMMSHFMLGAGGSQAGKSLSEVEAHLAEATRIANEQHLLQLAGRSQFEMGNMLAKRGNIDGALQSYQAAIDLAQQSGDPGQEILAHNNFAYHSLLTGDLSSAHRHIDVALAISESAAIQLPRQYVFSTRGEIALAECKWDEAVAWFNRGITEAEKAGNNVQIANYKANLGLAAHGRGDLDGALLYFEAAAHAVSGLTATFLQAQIYLWMTDLYISRGEHAAAEESIRRARDLTSEKGYQRLDAMVENKKREYHLG